METRFHHVYDFGHGVVQMEYPFTWKHYGNSDTSSDGSEKGEVESNPKLKELKG